MPLSNLERALTPVAVDPGEEVSFQKSNSKNFLDTSV